MDAYGTEERPRCAAAALAALEALAYDDICQGNAPSSDGQLHPRHLSPDQDTACREQRQKHANVVKQTWGWETGLQEAEEDLQQLKKQNSKTPANTTLSVTENEIQQQETVPWTPRMEAASRASVVKKAARTLAMKNERRDSRPGGEIQRTVTDTQEETKGTDEPCRRGKNFGGHWTTEALCQEVRPLFRTASNTAPRSSFLSEMNSKGQKNASVAFGADYKRPK